MRPLLPVLLLLALSAPVAQARPPFRGDAPAVAMSHDGRVAVAWIENGEWVRIAMGHVRHGLAPSTTRGAAGTQDYAVRNVSVALPGDGATVLAWERQQSEHWEGERLPREWHVTHASIAQPGGDFRPAPALGARREGSSLLSLAADEAGNALLGWTELVHGRTALRAPGGQTFQRSGRPGARGGVEAVALGGGEGLIAAARCGRGGCPLSVQMLPSGGVEELDPGRPDVPDAAAAMSPGGHALVAWRAGFAARAALREPGGRFGPAVDLSRNAAFQPAPAVTARGDALVLLGVRDRGGPAIRAMRRAPGSAAFAPAESPSGDAPAWEPALALAPGGTGIAAFEQDGGARVALRAADGTWSPPMSLGTVAGSSHAVAASDAGAAFAWSESGDPTVVRILLVPAGGDPQVVEVARYAPVPGRPVPARAAPRPRRRLPAGRPLRLRGRTLRVGVACGPPATCRGRLRVLDASGRELGSAPVRIRRRGRGRVSVRLARRVPGAELFLDLPGTLSDRRRVVRLTVE